MKRTACLAFVVGFLPGSISQLQFAPVPARIALPTMPINLPGIDLPRPMFPGPSLPHPSPSVILSASRPAVVPSPARTPSPIFSASEAQASRLSDRRIEAWMRELFDGEAGSRPEPQAETPVYTLPEKDLEKEIGISSAVEEEGRPRIESPVREYSRP